MKRYTYLIVWFVALAIIAGALLTIEGDLLWKAQQMNLFLNSKLFFQEQMVVPGGLLTWTSTFFTQFFYHPWLGVLLLCGWWWLLMWLTKQAFRIPDSWTGLTLIPVGLLLLTIVDTGYWIYMLKLQGHFFVATIGTTAVAALLWLFRLVPCKFQLRAVFIIVCCALGYPLMGVYGLAAPLLMAIWSWRLKENAVINSVVALLGVVAVPLLYYRYIYYQTNLANIYYAELPLYYLTEEYPYYYVPFYLLALFFVVVSVMGPIRPMGPMRKGLIRAFAVQTALLVVLTVGIVRFWFKDENYHRELAMQHAVEQLDWEGVLQEAAQQKDEPTRAIVMMKNLALARLGRQGNDMFLYKNGSKKYNAPFGMRTMLAVGPMIYFQYGMLNYCTRLCTEMGVEFGWRSEYLKLLAKCAILNGEQQPARKYLGLLERTTFFDDWAIQAESMVGDAEHIGKDPELAAVTHMMHYENDLNSDQGFVERFLMRQLAASTYTGDPIFQEQALLATLWTRDIKQFWQRFYAYIRLHPNDSMPRYYQEAAYLYGKLEGRTDLDRLPFDAGVKSTYERFMQEAVRYDDADLDIVREALYPFFGQTYYYDYYTMSQLPEF